MKEKQKRLIGFKSHDEDEDDDELEDDEDGEGVLVGNVDDMYDDEDGGVQIDLEALKEALGLNDKPATASAPVYNLNIKIGGKSKKGCKKCKCKKCKKR